MEHGKPALTDWCKLNTYSESFTLLRVRIHTGRTHQIRVHFSNIGHPLAGDLAYGAKKHSYFKRVMLHAYSLSFTHPTSGEFLTFKAELPADFEDSLSKLTEIK